MDDEMVCVGAPAVVAVDTAVPTAPTESKNSTHARLEPAPGAEMLTVWLPLGGNNSGIAASLVV